MVRFLLPFILLALLAGCMPASQGPGVTKSSSTSAPSPTTTTTTYQDPSFPFTTTFLQESSTKTNSGLSLPISFADSFLVRGKNLSTYLRKLPNTTKLCLVGKYSHVSGTTRYLVLSAKPKSFTDLIAKTTEFYLLVEPNNDQANQNDCLSYNFTQVLFNNVVSPSLSFSLSQVCSNCTTSSSSSPLKLYFNNGEEVPTATVSMGATFLTITGSTSTSTNSCVGSSECQARGFDCCLDNQCANDGAVRSSAILDPGFTAAQEDVRLNPTRFVLYPQYYFVCQTRPEEDGTPTNTDPDDPFYEASVRLMELTHLYNCLNKVDGEFSYCTLKFSQTSMPGTFPTATTGKSDDVNFRSLNTNLTGDYANNIVKIVYGSKTLYEQDKTPLTEGSFNSYNDDLSTYQTVDLTATLPSTAPDSNLYVSYKIDGTCERINSSLARCSKTYIQNHSDTKSTYYHDTTKTYLLPDYANVTSSYALVVKIGGVIVAEGASTWTRSSSPKAVVFAAGYPIYTNQKIEISYFVTSGISSLFASREAAQAVVNSMCTCTSTSKCNLKPVTDPNLGVTNYDCIVPVAEDTSVPASQTLYVSSKNVPHRYYDVNGVVYDKDYATAPAQEGSAFTYTNNNLLKPSNATAYTGFNEIYGSFNKSGNYIARPAVYARVKKEQQYDIVVSSGVYSGCATCGADYYSSLQKIFPANFAGGGGGFTPDYYQSSRMNNNGLYRSDDLLFGRACWVPATMFPWTHYEAVDPKDQRRSRLAAQHAMFANGYGRDWYGFDYGSVIGSFDGVTWFSIGSQRRIKATSSKLFLAVNAYYGDVNIDSNFKVLVAEFSPYSSAIPTHDMETDGAECQRAHFCSNDVDCATLLGPDYTCQPVTSITTKWPMFDASANETSGAQTKTLVSIVGGANGVSKRCVYRGRGAPCYQNLSSISNTFNGISTVGTLACSPNNSCQATSTSRFNDRISRFANSVLNQNLAGVHSPDADTFGLGAPILGRPLNYYGTAAIATDAKTSLDQNKVNALCVPGRDVSTLASTGTTYATKTTFHTTYPTSTANASDKLMNMGVSPDPGTTTHAHFLLTCPFIENTTKAWSWTKVGSLNDNWQTAFAQNLSTASLNHAELKTSGNSIFASYDGNQVTTAGYARNACLKTAGTPCFSDMECAPSAFIASKVKAAASSLSMSTLERTFWSEELVCGNPEPKLLDSGAKNSAFDVKKNRCCRETGNIVTTFTETSPTPDDYCAITTPGGVRTINSRVPGRTDNLFSNNRASRGAVGFDKYVCSFNPTSSDTRSALTIDTGGTTATDMTNGWKMIQAQYKTLDTINTLQCCSENWVRSFHTENGGGHQFSKAKGQTYNWEMFKHINWAAENQNIFCPLKDPDSEDVDTNGDNNWCNDTRVNKYFVCAPSDDPVENYRNSSCEVKSFTETQAQKYLEYGASFELLGIPQVPIKSHESDIYKTVDDQQAAYAPGVKRVLNGTTKEAQGRQFTDGSGNQYYSASNFDAFELESGGGTNKLRKIFSDNEFNCCIPSGRIIPASVTEGQCCTGFIADDNNQRRCCLRDYTDLTVYLNRYVSSEGRGLPDSAYDEATGYIKDPAMVAQIAADKNLCCSGTTMMGRAYSTLPFPLQDGKLPPVVDTSTTGERFYYVDGITDDNAQTDYVGTRILRDGLKWNNHVYCVPASYQ